MTLCVWSARLKRDDLLEVIRSYASKHPDALGFVESPNECGFEGMDTFASRSIDYEWTVRAFCDSAELLAKRLHHDPQCGGWQVRVVRESLDEMAHAQLFEPFPKEAMPQRCRNVRLMGVATGEDDEFRPLSGPESEAGRPNVRYFPDSFRYPGVVWEPEEEAMLVVEPMWLPGGAINRWVRIETARPAKAAQSG